MSVRAEASAEQRDPTPDPGSAIVRSSRDERLAAAIDEARALYGSEAGDAWFAALVDGTHPLCRLAADDQRPPTTEADLATAPALLEAAERYAGEATHDREIADARAGRHPLQRPLSPG